MNVNLLDITVQAALEAGKIALRNFTAGEHDIVFKDRHNIVTATDTECERSILETLQRYFPRHSYFSEEIGYIHGDADCLWVIDPLDGTTNFSKGFMHFCISIAFYYKKAASAAVVYNPISDELFTASRGSGAYLNGKKISTAGTDDLGKSVVMLNRGATREEKIRAGEIFCKLVPSVRSIRILGATALDLCFVACGRTDALINNGCEYYDAAAGNLVAEEAGARVTNFKGVPWKLERSDLLVARPSLHAQLVQCFI